MTATCVTLYMILGILACKMSLLSSAPHHQYILVPVLVQVTPKYHYIMYTEGYNTISVRMGNTPK